MAKHDQSGDNPEQAPREDNPVENLEVVEGTEGTEGENITLNTAEGDTPDLAPPLPDVDPVIEIIAADAAAIEEILTHSGERIVSVPKVGEEFTPEQDAAVFSQLQEVLEEFYAAFEESGLVFEEDFLDVGAFTAWTNGVVPYTRGASDVTEALGYTTWSVSDDGDSYISFAVLDLELGMIYMTVPSTLADADYGDEVTVGEEITAE